MHSMHVPILSSSSSSLVLGSFLDHNYPPRSMKPASEVPFTSIPHKIISDAIRQLQNHMTHLQRKKKYKTRKRGRGRRTRTKSINPSAITRSRVSSECGVQLNTPVPCTQPTCHYSRPRLFPLPDHTRPRLNPCLPSSVIPLCSSDNLATPYQTNPKAAGFDGERRFTQCPAGVSRTQTCASPAQHHDNRADDFIVIG